MWGRRTWWSRLVVTVVSQANANANNYFCSKTREHTRTSTDTVTSLFFQFFVLDQPEMTAPSQQELRSIHDEVLFQPISSLPSLHISTF
jgi:hypothetical protein